MLKHSRLLFLTVDRFHTDDDLVLSSSCSARHHEVGPGLADLGEGAAEAVCGLRDVSAHLAAGRRLEEHAGHGMLARTHPGCAVRTGHRTGCMAGLTFFFQWPLEVLQPKPHLALGAFFPMECHPKRNTSEMDHHNLNHGSE